MSTLSTVNQRNLTGKSQVQSERVRPLRLVWAGPLTALAASICSIAVREIGAALGTIPGDLQILQEPAVAVSTIAFVLVGALVFAVVARFSKHPAGTFRRVAVVALILSFFNPIAAGMGWIPVGAPVGAATVVTMLVMHVVAAAVTMYLLPRLILEQ
jgi:hypothetical protein